MKVIAKQLEYLKLEFTFSRSEMKNAFENAVIEFKNFASDFEMRPSSKVKPKLTERELSKSKLEKFASMFEKY
jgi:hypothetical protein